VARLEDIAYDTNTMLRKLCAQGKVDIPSLQLRIPDMSLLKDFGSGTPPTASVISTISTTSLNFDRMTMESPSPQFIEPPVAGPSGVARGTHSCSPFRFRLLMSEVVPSQTVPGPVRLLVP
jgi:hypothetical protein